MIALYVLYTYMLKQRKRVLGAGKTVGGVNKKR
jgi:very-long-chain (3R)-3-hydroxyacyl-CoA dehydratase